MGICVDLLGLAGQKCETGDVGRIEGGTHNDKPGLKEG